MKMLEKRNFEAQIMKTLLESYTLGNHLCDVVLCVDGVSIKAHKAVLASFSVYFADLFVEQDTLVCNISPEIESHCLILLLDYMYTGQLHTNAVSHSSMYETAVKLNIPSVQELLLQVLGSISILDNRTKNAQTLNLVAHEDSKVIKSSKKKKDKVSGLTMSEECNKQMDYENDDPVDFEDDEGDLLTADISDEEYTASKKRQQRKKSATHKKTDGSKNTRKKEKITVTGRKTKKARKKPSKDKLPLKHKVSKLTTKSRAKQCSKFRNKKVNNKKSKLQSMKLKNLHVKCHCGTCSKPFKLYTFLKKHMYIKHKHMSGLLDQGKICLKRIQRQAKVRRFLQKTCVSVAQTNATSVKPKQNGTMASDTISLLEQKSEIETDATAEVQRRRGKHRYLCICGQSFRYYSTFTLHVNRKHAAKQQKSVFKAYSQHLSVLVQIYRHKRKESTTISKNSRRKCRTAKTMEVNKKEYPAPCSVCFVEQQSCDIMVKHLVSDHRYNIRDAEKDAGMDSRLSLTCRECEKCFDSKESLSIHIGIAHPLSKTCPRCDQEQRSVAALKKHLRIEHDLTAQEVKFLLGEVMSCEVTDCPFQTCSGVKLKKHVMACHPEVEYRCPECGYLFHVKSQRDRHVKQRHSHNLKKATRNMCELCGKTFSKPYHLMNHNYTAHGIRHPKIKIYKCEVPDCGYEAVTATIIKQHVKIKHSERIPIPCPYCDKELRSEIILRKHINTMHLNIRPHMCHVCGLSFGMRGDLQAHIDNKHSDEKQFHCEYCAYATSNKNTFRTHLFVIHKVQEENDKRPIYTCDQCGFVSIILRRFKNHMNRHKNIREFTCKHCDKKFMTSGTLRTHIQWNHSNTFHSCSECDYKTKTRQKLNEHIRIQHMLRGIKPYKCPYCDFHCSSGGNCRKHIMQRHKGMKVYYEKNETILAAARTARQTGASLSVVQEEEISSNCNVWETVVGKAQSSAHIVDMGTSASNVSNNVNMSKGQGAVPYLTTIGVSTLDMDNNMSNNLLPLQNNFTPSAMNTIMYQPSS